MSLYHSHDIPTSYEKDRLTMHDEGTMHEKVKIKSFQNMRQMLCVINSAPFYFCATEC